MRIKSFYFKKTFPFLLLIITVLVQLLFKNNRALTEGVYSTGIYWGVATVMSRISSLFPFSLDDLFYSLLVILFLAGLALVLLKKLELKKFSIRCVQVVVLVYVSFYWLWGFNYYRQPAHERLGLTKSNANDSTFILVFNEVIEKANLYYVPDSVFNMGELNHTIESSYQGLADYLKIKYPSGKRPIKHITFSDFFAKATILGYYGPFFNETHINKHLTPWDIPVVAAHEKSHQLGVSSEAEASFYGWLVSVNSKDNFVRYAGWFYALEYFVYQSRKLKDRKGYIKKIRPEIIEDMKRRHKHWMAWRNETIDNAASKVNDAYLKSNNVEGGIDDYNGVVQLIVDYMLGRNLKKHK